MRPRDLIPLVLVGAGAAFLAVQIANAPSPPPPAPAPSAAEPGAPRPESANRPAVESQGMTRSEVAQLAVASAPPPSRDDNAVRVMLRDGAAGTYILDMLAEKERLLVRWPERQAEPLRVWIARTSGVANWNAEYPLAAERSFAEWRAAGFPIAFQFVHDSASAQIRITWRDKFAAGERQIGRTQKLYDRHGWLVQSDITLATHDGEGRTLSPELITGVARHEVGHALGLYHSSSRDDVMYPEAYTTRISAADRATLYLLYKLPPGRMP